MNLFTERLASLYDNALRRGSKQVTIEQTLQAYYVSRDVLAKSRLILEKNKDIPLPKGEHKKTDEDIAYYSDKINKKINLLIYRQYGNPHGLVCYLIDKANLLGLTKNRSAEAFQVAKEAHLLATKHDITDLVAQIEPVMDALRLQATQTDQDDNLKS